MEAYSDGIASIRHHETGRIYEIEGDTLDWEIVDGDERGTRNAEERDERTAAHRQF